MTVNRNLIAGTATLAFVAAFALPTGAQQGASSVLPVWPEPFKGTINPRAKDSKPDFPQPLQAPKGAPNILIALLDDVGYGATSTFGGPINNPTLQKLADNGLRYNQFHTTCLSENSIRLGVAS
jgi:arylsulfatase